MQRYLDALRRRVVSNTVRYYSTPTSMISKSLLVICVALTVIVVQSAQTTTCTSHCLDGTTRSVTCMGGCRATPQSCSGTTAVGGVAKCETGSPSIFRSCSSSPNPCVCGYCSPSMCGIHPDNCGGSLNCGPCPCYGTCYRSKKCCRQDSDCTNGGESGSGNAGGGGGGDGGSGGSGSGFDTGNGSEFCIPNGPQ